MSYKDEVILPTYAVVTSVAGAVAFGVGMMVVILSDVVDAVALVSFILGLFLWLTATSILLRLRRRRRRIGNERV